MIPFRLAAVVPALLVAAACAAPEPASQASPSSAPAPSASVSPAPAGSLPIPRLDRPIVAYDAGRSEAILVGPSITKAGAGGAPGAVAAHSETWAWRAGAWRLLAPRSSPPPRTWAGLAYDQQRKEVVLFGGQDVFERVAGKGLEWYGDTWIWNGSDWSERRPTTSPPPSVQASLAYDASLGEVVGVLHTEDGYESWGWDGRDWRPLGPKTVPVAGAIGAGLAYDAARGVLVLFGTYSCAFYQCTADPDTWTFDGQSWTKHPGAAGGPPPRGAAALGYDDSSRQVIMFGGSLMSESFGDTWGWDGERWTRLSTAEAPSPRSGSIATDGKVFLFGGGWHSQANGVNYVDTWLWTDAGWRLAEPGAGPADTGDAAAILAAAESPEGGGSAGAPVLGTNAGYVVYRQPSRTCVSYVLPSPDGLAAGWRSSGYACGTPGADAPRLGVTLRLQVEGCGNVRTLPSLTGKIITCLPTGTEVTIDDGPAGFDFPTADATVWWHLNALGWMSQAVFGS